MVPEPGVWPFGGKPPLCHLRGMEHWRQGHSIAQAAACLSAERGQEELFDEQSLISGARLLLCRNGKHQPCLPTHRSDGWAFPAVPMHLAERWHHSAPRPE